MAQLPIPELVSHTQKVCRLYKRALRHLESWCVHIDDFRYRAVLMRKQFDDNKNVRDLRVAKKLLQEGEAELFNKQHYCVKSFPDSPDGCAYNRYAPVPDWVLDYWHPIEKAMYPKYFATREKRKIEYEEFFRKQYGKSPDDEDAHHH